ncbi:MAG: alternative ribosome rescue aminoacyl-tRNA hydrolase ArfB [Planctomycetota bacterium]
MTADRDLQLNRGHMIPARVIAWRFDRSSGPGGQNVNKTATQATLTVTFDDLAEQLPDSAMRKLRELSSPAIAEDRVVIQASSSRSQWQNRSEALRKLRAVLQLALQPDKPRRPTRVPRSVVRRRLEHKRRRSEVKTNRRAPDAE